MSRADDVHDRDAPNHRWTHDKNGLMCERKRKTKPPCQYVGGGRRKKGFKFDLEHLRSSPASVLFPPSFFLGGLEFD